MDWENEYDANNNDHVEPAGVVAEQPWQYICLRRGSRDFQLATHGLLLVCKPIKDAMVLSLHVVEVKDASHLKVEALKMTGDLVFEKDFKKETTFGRVKQRIAQELLNKHGYTDVDAENVTMCAQGILLAKDFLRCVISKKEILATYRANGTLLNRRR